MQIYVNQDESFTDLQILITYSFNIHELVMSPLSIIKRSFSISSININMRLIRFCTVQLIGLIYMHVSGMICGFIVFS